VQVLLDLPRVAAAHLAERARPEHPPDDRSVLKEALPLRRESVEAGGDQGLHGVRERDVLRCLRQQVAVCEQAHVLLRVERVSARAVEQSALCLDGQHGLLEQEREEARGVLVGQRGRLIAVALRSPAAQLGRCSYSSGRAVQSKSSGTLSDQSARCSRKERKAVSAQCRSSKQSTVGPLSASDSKKRRQAVYDSSCAADSAGAPTSGERRALSQARS